MIDAFAAGVTIELPADLPPGVVAQRIDTGHDGIVLELPTEVHGDEQRLDVERRVLEPLRKRSPSRGRAFT